MHCHNIKVVLRKWTKILIGKSINEDKNVTLEDVLDDQRVEFAEEMESFKETKDKRFLTSYQTGTGFF